MAISLSSLSPPRTQLWFAKGNTQTKWTSLERRIKDHPLNYAVEVFIPNRKSLPNSVSSFSSLPYFSTERLPLSHFLQPSILGRYFSSDSEGLVGLTSEGRIDIHKVFALLPNGKLVLSIDKDTFEELGLQGKKSRYQKNRYLVEIDLISNSFKPGRAGYERTLSCLKDKSELQAKFIFSWDKTDPQSRRQFAADFRAKINLCKFDCTTLYNFSLPTVDDCHPNGCYDDSGAEVSCSARDFYTWLGGMACGVDVYEGGAPGDYVSTFTVPEPHSECGQGVKGRWTGLITASKVWELIGLLKQYLEVEEDLPWASVSVWGFEDAPVSWKTNEHGWLCSGDNHFTVVLFRTGQYWAFTSMATHDAM